MSLVSETVPNLIQGVSQQPVSLRLPTQLAEQENCYSSEVKGLIRRPPTELVAKISDDPMDEAFMHTINRDANERYEAVLTDDDIKVFDLDGTEKTVNTVDTSVRLLDGAVAIQNGQVFIIAPAPGETSIDFVVTGITTATAKLQTSPDNSVWTDAATRTTNGATTVAIPVGALYMRGIISAWTSGAVTCSATYKNVRYLICDDPKEDLRALTIADFTFIVNTTKTVLMDDELSADRNAEALIFAKQGEYNSIYSVYINGTQRATFTTHATDASTIRTDNIATEIYNDLVGWAGSGFTFTKKGSIVHVSCTSDFTIRTEDSQGGVSMPVFKDIASRFSELPANAPDGFTIQIDSNPDTQSGAYYVTAHSNQASETFGEVTWQESIQPGIEYIIDPSTMPHALVKEEDGTFTFTPIEWDDRLCGDDETNEVPSFIGETVNELMFYKNRLGLLAGENFLMSETAQYYNFWRTTVTQILDTDPVDFRPTNTKVSILKRSVTYNTDLVLFSDQTQFRIPGDVAMTPKTVRCDPASEFESNLGAAPFNFGKSICFIFNREDYAGMKELQLADDGSNKFVEEDVTAHVPAYIPAGVFRIAHSTIEDVACLLTSGEPNAIYVYKAKWNKQDQKIQSAWFKWTFGEDETTKVLDASFIESTLYLLIQRDGEVFIEKMILMPSHVDSGSTYKTHLDRRYDEDYFASVTYDSVLNRTTFLTPPVEPSDNTLMVSKAGRIPQIVSQDATSTVVRGDYSATPVWVGLTYESFFDLGKLFKRKQSPSGGSVIDTLGVLQLLRGYFTYDNTGYFKVSVTPEGRSTSDYIFTGRVVGDVNNILGNVALRSGTFPFAILSRNTRVTIQLSSDSFVPFGITSLDWEGNFTKRSAG